MWDGPPRTRPVDPAAWTPERYRALLRLYAHQLQLDPRLRRRFDSSDLVQESLLKAHRQREQFRGTSEGELLGWLRQILANSLADLVDQANARKRDARRDRPIHAAVDDSSAVLDRFLADRGLAPDAEAERREVLLRLAEAVERLPDDQREVVILRDLAGCPVAEIARRLGRTEKSVAGLLLRGRRALRAEFPDSF